MDALKYEIVEVSPVDPVVLPLISAHLTLMRASSPACSVHAMEPVDLANAGARFFAVIDEGEAVAIGALKALNDGYGELKSMHVRQDKRGSGLAKAVLLKLLDVAQEVGMHSVSLETGSQDVFAPARAFYQRYGFRMCKPFADYTSDPASVFFTLRLQ
ncbi:MAG: GNAT family N-acetyltransferase [Boseongicola sp.]